LNLMVFARVVPNVASTNSCRGSKMEARRKKERCPACCRRRSEQGACPCGGRGHASPARQLCIICRWSTREIELQALAPLATLASVNSAWIRAAWCSLFLKRGKLPRS